MSKRKKINQKFIKKQMDHVAKMFDEVWDRIGEPGQIDWTQIPKKQRELLLQFLRWAEIYCENLRWEVDDHFDEEGNIKPKPKTRRRKKTNKGEEANTPKSEPPKSLSDLPPLSSILSTMFFRPFLPPKPKDKWPEELDT